MDRVVVRNRRGIPITVRELTILDRNDRQGWLNDEIINYFFGQVDDITCL